MGKRELLIIVGFVIVGAIAYQVAAPPATGESGFSFSNFFNEARREIRGNPGSGKFVHTASVPVPDGLREVRIIGVTEQVKVIGEDRKDIDYEFTVSSNGEDDAAALGYAKETKLTRDDLGDSMVFRTEYPKPGSQRSTIVMRVPSRLAVRVESTVGADVSNVAGVHMEAVRSTVAIKDIAGSVTGAQQDGDIAIIGAKSIKLRLLRSKSTITKVASGVVLDLRDAECEIAESTGALEIDQARSDVTVTSHKGPVTVRGNDGSITINHPTEETRVDVRRAEIELLIERAVPMTIITSDEPIRLILAGSPAFALDAATTDAKIQAAEFDVKPEASEADARLSHQFGGKSDVRITLRNTRGDVVLRKKK
jgi:hypothetical protein